MKNFFLSILLISVVFALSPKQLHAQCPLTEAVDFTVTDLEGNTINLFEILDGGQYVVIDFFFTSCGPCQSAAPFINEAYEHFGCGDHDVKFIAMDTGDDNAACEWFDETFGVTYPTVSGIEGGGTAVCSAYGIPAYPTVILIAPDHSILEQDIWPIPNAGAVISPLESYGLQAHECGATPLSAEFEASAVDICDTEQIQFSDLSLGEVESWAWTFEGGDPATSTEQNPIVTYNTAGIFTVELTVSNESEESTTIDTEMITVHNCTGLAEYSKLEMTITPNPSHGNFFIDFSAEDYYEVFVYDMTGHIVYDAKLSNNNNLLDLSHLENGIYIVKASNGMTQIKERVVIQK